MTALSTEIPMKLNGHIILTEYRSPAPGTVLSEFFHVTSGTERLTGLFVHLLTYNMYNFLKSDSSFSHTYTIAGDTAKAL